MSEQNNRKKQNLPIGNRGEKDAGFIPSLKLKSTKQQYIDRFFNQFQSKYKVSSSTDSVTPESINYLFRRFWADGKVAAWKIKNTDLLGFAQYGVETYNIWDYPDRVQLTTRRNATPAVIPQNSLTVGRDVVLGYIRPDKKPMSIIADNYAQRLEDVDKAIQLNLLVQRSPWILLVNPETKKRVAEYFRRLFNDEIVLTMNPDDVNSVSVLQTAVPYIIDKLEIEKTTLMHQALTDFGFDNCSETGGANIVAEVSLNSKETQDINDTYNQCLDDFEKQVKEVLNLNLHFEPRAKQMELLSDKVNAGIEDKDKQRVREEERVHERKE